MNIMNYISWEMILIVIAVNLFVDFVKLKWKPNNWVIRLFVFAVAISMAFCVSRIPGVPALGFFQGLAIGLLSIILFDSGGYPWLRDLIKGLIVSLIDSLKSRFGGGGV
ncbi:hypothetical protein [Seleniivibrio woodruffii]|uniref:hypothetical protein n=1 Tax=Seleniivibrio woodruffii TaxID=1078050 RepID=UPI002409AC03|nr:hypothetical protein [Seleniivibrio woodruffii]